MESTQRAELQASHELSPIFERALSADPAGRYPSCDEFASSLPFSQVDNDGLQGSPGHGLFVSPDGSQLWSTSKPNNHVYAWSLPDLDYLGGVAVGHHPDWLTMTPDGRYLYAANAGSNTVSVIDTQKLERVTDIDVGQTPKRNHTVVIR